MSVNHKSVFSSAMTSFFAVIILALSLTARAAEFLELPNGSKLDLSQKCPVCGMVIGGKEGQGVTVTYRDGRVVEFGGVTAAVFKDAHVVGFEGARCLFIYNSVPQKYNVDVKNIAYQYVTDFVSKKMIDLSKSFLVLGSNVKGPMGYELIPFTTKEEAAKFAADNDGKWIVQLHEVARTAEDKQESKQLGAAEKEPLKSDDRPEAAAPPAKEKKRVPEKRYIEQRPRPSGHHGHH